MTKIFQKDNQTGRMLHQCEECGLHYEDKELAEQCRVWCKERQSCNIEIICHAEESKQSPRL